MEATACLQNLVGVKADNNDFTQHPQYIENLTGVDIVTLAKMSNAQDVNGIVTANGLIKSAADMMMGDLQLLVGNGWMLQETLGETCSNCDFVNMYQGGGMGIKVTNTALSKVGQIYISLISVKTDYTGTATMVLNDGVQPIMYNINVIKGMEMPVRLSYKTEQKVVRITLQDATIGMAQVTCPQVGGCGCGGSSAKGAKIRYSGIMGNMDVPQQYGFKVCASVVCSSDVLLCGLINALPNIFALTLLYKVGELYYTSLVVNTRNNESRTLDEDTLQGMADKYTGLYREKMNGTDVTKSLKTIIGRYMAQQKDECMICNTVNATGWVGG